MVGLSLFLLRMEFIMNTEVLLLILKVVYLLLGGEW